MIDYDEKCDRLFAIVEDKTYSGDSHNDDIIKFTGFAISGIAKKIGLQPVVHGKNITKRHPVDEFICSECGIVLVDYERLEIDEDDGDENCYEYEFRFCPNCGAKMDEREGTQ